MIKFEHTEVVGLEHAIRGMRNPLNSWKHSDSGYVYENEDSIDPNNYINEILTKCYTGKDIIKFSRHYLVGGKDLGLMKTLKNAGKDHRKYMRMIAVYVDITAPLYWWKQFDTYKVGTVANSCSTMHKIQAKEFTLDDFSHEHLGEKSLYILNDLIHYLNAVRKAFNSEPNRKDYWWQMIQLLPSSYNQKRTVMLNYEVLASIYKSRKNHKLDEWAVGFMNWIKNLPYSELIMGEVVDHESKE